MTARSKIASPTRRRNSSMATGVLHIGALPVTIEIQRARPDGAEGNVVIVLRTAKAIRNAE